MSPGEDKKHGYLRYFVKYRLQVSFHWHLYKYEKYFQSQDIEVAQANVLVRGKVLLLKKGWMIGWQLNRHW